MDARTAFITGASSGIGKALALRLAREGVEVGLAARRTEQLEGVAQLIRQSGGRAQVFALDVRQPKAVFETMQRADDIMQGIDLVIANAGLANNRRAQKFRWAECEDMLAVNVTGAAATLTALLDRMIARDRGHLVGVSSLAGMRALPGMAAYTATKAFLSRFLEGLRIDLSGSNVHITDVRPGFVSSEMTEHYKTTGQPMPFLVSAEAAANIITESIISKEPVIAFPWQMKRLMQTATLLPETVWRKSVRKIM